MTDAYQPSASSRRIDAAFLDAAFMDASLDVASLDVASLDVASPDAAFSARIVAVPAAGATAHATGHVSVANPNAAFIKTWAPPPRRVPL